MRIQRIPVASSANDTSAVDLTMLDAIIEKHQQKKGNLIPLLQETQDTYGYLPQSALEKLAKEAKLALSDLYGVATFYAQFRLKPAGKHIIKICHGTACHVQDASLVSEALEESLNIKDGETTKDGLFTLESVACLGCCSLAPVMMIGDETYGKLTGKQAVKIVRELRLTETKK